MLDPKIFKSSLQTQFKLLFEIHTTTLESHVHVQILAHPLTKLWTDRFLEPEKPDRYAGQRYTDRRLLSGGVSEW
jgi:hypothetical protein